MSSEDVSLGTWGCQSGNRCAVGMKIMKAAEVSLTFSWDKEPSPNDLEEWSFTVFGVALDRAMEQAFQYRAAVEVLRKLEGEGAIERVGIAKDGEWIFRGKDTSTIGESAGVVSLAAMRDRRQSRRRYLDL